MQWTASAQRVLDHRAGPLLVLGGPGTGKTSLLVELVAERIAAGHDPAEVLVLAPSRRAAAELRDRVAARVGRTIREPLARTAHSYAFGLLRREAASSGAPSPRLLAGAEQELMIAEMLPMSSATWPDDIGPALRTRSFAGQLRDLLLRAVERDLRPADLAVLGAEHDRPLWRSAAEFAREYAGVTALAHPSAYDASELVRAAVDLLRSDPGLLSLERAERALIVVDDVAEADPALLDLLELLGGGGHPLVATADPDTTVFGFRGTDPQAIGEFRDRFRAADGASAPQVVLAASNRLPSALAEPAARVSARLGGRGPWRALTPRAGTVGSLRTAVLASTSDEMAHVAATLRRRHLLDGVPWSSMAVVLRSAADLSVARRNLTRHGVPVGQRTDEVALWQQAPVRALLDLLAVVSGHETLSSERLVDLLLGPLGRLDPARLAVLRRALFMAERHRGGVRDVDDILRLVVLGDEALPNSIREPAVAALSATVAAGRAVAASGSVEEVLWALWDSVGLAQSWRAMALSGRSDAAAADRDLDAVVALFEAAARFTDRLPGAGPAAFLDHVRAQQIPGDTWATAAPLPEAVHVLTAHATKGREWNTVAVCRVQEDLWPDLRRRQSLLGVEDLVAAVDQGRVPSAAEQVSSLLAGERRLFYLATTRASDHVLVTAVDDGELRPSRLLDELDPQPVDEWAAQPADHPLGLASLVAELRAAVCDPQRPDVERDEAARQLARLASHGVPGADPQQWYGLAEPTDSAPLVGEGETTRLSPSQVESYLRCPLRWMLQRGGGEDGRVLHSSIGLLIHQLAQEAAAGDWDGDRVWERYEQLWSSVDAGRGWVAHRQRARVDAMVRRLIQWLESNRSGFVAAEVDVETDLAGATVKGRLDRLQRDESGGLVVVDFKTGSRSTSTAEVVRHPQLGVYQAAVAEGAVGDAGDRPAGGLLVQLGDAASGEAKVQRQPPLDDFDDPQWPVGLVRQVAAGLGDPFFAALANAGCDRCPVRASCPAHPDGGRVVP